MHTPTLILHIPMHIHKHQIINVLKFSDVAIVIVPVSRMKLLVGLSLSKQRIISQSKYILFYLHVYLYS